MEEIKTIIKEIMKTNEGKGKIIPLSDENCIKAKYAILVLNYKNENNNIKPNCKRFRLSIVEILGEYEKIIKEFKEKIPNNIKNYGNKACREVENSEIPIYTEPYTYEQNLEKRIKFILNSIKNNKKAIEIKEER